MPNWCMNRLSVTGPTDDLAKFKRKANGPTQAYNDFRESGSWPVHDDIRLKASVSTPPELGPVVDFSFHSLYPVPEEFMSFPYDCSRAREIGELVGNTRPYGGYRWEQIHWGCKWGGCETELLLEEEGYIEYSFDTPWGPPMEFIEKISKDWPTLCFEITYEEPGMGFAGNSSFYQGECCHANTWDLESDMEDDCDDE